MEPKIDDQEYIAFLKVADVLYDNGHEQESMRIRGYADGMMALPPHDAVPADHDYLEEYLGAHACGLEDCGRR